MTDDNRYAGWRGTLRIIGEVLADVPGQLKADVARVWAIATNDAAIDGETCQIEGCDRVKVGTIPSTLGWEDDYDACRRHWLGHYAIVYTAECLVWVVLIGLFFATSLVLFGLFSAAFPEVAELVLVWSVGIGVGIFVAATVL